ncbi:hypothetical protein ACWEQ7_27275 [Streptomyces sp. NPDC004069]
MATVPGHRRDLAMCSAVSGPVVGRSLFRVVIALPADVKDVFEGWHTGDPTNDAVLADAGRAQTATNYAIIKGNPDKLALAFYRQGNTLVSGAKWVKSFVDAGITYTGTVRYFNPNVITYSQSEAGVTFCTDETKAFNKVAYNRISLPDTEVTLAPQHVAKVNLPTWAWLDSSTYKPVQVTASLNVAGLNIQATTTARPASLKLQPGTTDAQTYPAFGECAINNDGSIGEPCTRGKSSQTPPCGIKYLRSFGNGTYTLKATITWRINWTGTGGAGGELPDGTFGAAQDVTVQEIQAVNR